VMLGPRRAGLVRPLARCPPVGSCAVESRARIGDLRGGGAPGQRRGRPEDATNALDEPGWEIGRGHRALLLACMEKSYPEVLAMDRHREQSPWDVTNHDLVSGKGRGGCEPSILTFTLVLALRQLFLAERVSRRRGPCRPAGMPVGSDSPGSWDGSNIAMVSALSDEPTSCLERVTPGRGCPQDPRVAPP
jgi:hypothetical protein